MCNKYFVKHTVASGKVSTCKVKDHKVKQPFLSECDDVEMEYESNDSWGMLMFGVVPDTNE